jgi:hypothetical protein
MTQINILDLMSMRTPTPLFVTPQMGLELGQMKSTAHQLAYALSKIGYKVEEQDIPGLWRVNDGPELTINQFFGGFADHVELVFPPPPPQFEYPLKGPENFGLCGR